MRYSYSMLLKTATFITNFTLIFINKRVIMDFLFEVTQKCYAELKNNSLIVVF